jgi:hypothetical protein
MRAASYELAVTGFSTMSLCVMLIGSWGDIHYQRQWYTETLTTITTWCHIK